MKRSAILAAAAALVLPLLLGACRDDEQSRLLYLKPGVYLGKQDAELSAATLTKLRERAGHQADTFGEMGGGPSRTSPSDVRPPDDAVGKSFKDRLSEQNF